LVVCLVLWNVVRAQDTATPEFISNELESYVERSLEVWKIPGIAICVVKDGEIIIERGYGVKQYNKSEPVDEHTLFLLGSASKAFIATALANLVYQGKCSLNDPVEQWLPAFRLSDPWVSKQVTVQDFLSHRSGLGTFQGDFMFYDSELTKKDVYAVLGKLELKNDFRTYGYTNIGYFLVGEVIEAVSGNQLADQLKKNIFMPLEMTQTLSIPSNFLQASNRSTPHTVENGRVTLRRMGDSDNMAAAGGISSSVSDLSNWLMAQLDSGRFNETRALPGEVIEMVRTPQILLGKSGPPYTLFNSSNFENYASGWYNLDYEGTEIITHNGGTYGFTSSITLIPEHNLGIAILTNSDQHLLFDAVKLEIIDAYLGLPFRNYSKLAQSFYQFRQMQKQEDLEQILQLVKAAPKPGLPLEKYMGTYKNEVCGEINIIAKEGALLMKFQHHATLEGEMHFMEEGKFLCSFNQSIYGKIVIPFTIENGEVKGMEFSVDENVEPHSYDFDKIE